MPKSTRTFVAIAIPPPLGERLTRLQELLAPAIPSARWSSSQPFHMTLAFLGDVPDSDLNPVCLAVAQASSPFAAFELRLEGVGAFPSPARPRVIWAGLTAPDDSPLFDVQKSIVRSLTRVGYRPDDQRFTPHATLGRIRQDRHGPRPADVSPTLDPYRNWSGGTFNVSEVITFGSTLTSQGPIYAPLARAPLAGKKMGPPP
jgi:2'-5' RNA ligase